MKDTIHPKYETTSYVCSCGSTFDTGGTKGGSVHLELCNKCHPFFTGQQKFVDTGGRVQRFSDKFGAAAAATLEREAKVVEERRVAAEAAEAAKAAERATKAAEKAKKAAKFEKTAEVAETPAETAEVAEVVAEDAAPEAAPAEEAAADAAE